jgi:hypothetical protein
MERYLIFLNHVQIILVEDWDWDYEVIKLDKYKGLIDFYGVNSFIKNMHEYLFTYPICKPEFAVQCA